VFNAWPRTVFRAAGFELARTLKTLSAPWDRRMLPVANGEAVCVFVADWVEEPIPGVVAVQFDPPLSSRPTSRRAGRRATARERWSRRRFASVMPRAFEGSNPSPAADLERLLEQWVKRSSALKTLGLR
jgi:hypothetical protein